MLENGGFGPMGCTGVPLPVMGGSSGLTAGQELEFQEGSEAQEWWVRGFPMAGNRGSGKFLGIWVQGGLGASK